MNTQLAVLDLAGTTVRDPGLVEAATKRVTGAAFDAAVFAAHRGGSKRDMLAALVGPEHADDALAAFDGELRTAIDNDAVEPLPHAEATLHGLRALGVRTCLVTGFSTATREALLNRLGWTDVVDLALSPDAQTRGRPHPDLILRAALELHADAVGNIAVAGDTANDIIAARRAGAGIAAGVLTGAHDRNRLQCADPTHILDHIGQLNDLLDRP